MADKIHQFLARVKFVSLHDLLQVFPASVAYVASWAVKRKHSNVWLVCERRDEARDNGYWFYRYLCEHHPEIEAVYAIDKAAADYKRVAVLGKVIQFGSLAHWTYYFSAKRNISSQKEGKPNAALCFVLEVMFNRVRNRAYIRHGIAKDRQEWVYWPVTKMSMFTCSAKKEYEMVKHDFGYPEGSVKLVGLCRYDNLLTPHEEKRQIVVMPTMREWLRIVSSDTEKYEGHRDVSRSEYVIKWNSVLQNERIHKLLVDNDVNLIFYPHSTMQRYIGMFSTSSTRITIADARHYDVQQLLVESAALVTDYSSVFFDFAYMKKPLIYYQFDYEKYRAGQYKQGYFSYVKDGFGPVAYQEDQLVEHLSAVLDDDMKMKSLYKERVEGFFAYMDDRNCERTFDAILSMLAD